MVRLYTVYILFLTRNNDLFLFGRQVKKKIGISKLLYKNYDVLPRHLHRLAIMQTTTRLKVKL